MYILVISAILAYTIGLFCVNLGTYLGGLDKEKWKWTWNIISHDL